VTLLSPSFCIITITYISLKWPNWTNYDSNWLLTHRILQTWSPATIICFQTSSGGSRERDSHRMRKSSRKSRRISKAWTFRTTERASKCWKIAISSVSPSKAMLRNKYNFAQKTLVFIKNPSLFSPCNILRSRSSAVALLFCSFIICNLIYIFF